MSIERCKVSGAGLSVVFVVVDSFFPFLRYLECVNLEISIGCMTIDRRNLFYRHF